jgi:hypothetical protein
MAGFAKDYGRTRSVYGGIGFLDIEIFSGSDLEGFRIEG